MEAIRDIMLPDAPALVVGPAGAVWLDRDGEIHALRLDSVARRMRGGAPPLLCHMPAMARRLNVDVFPALDLLELFAFVHPGRFCVPTPRGLAATLGLEAPHDHEAEAIALGAMTRALLQRLAAVSAEPQMISIAQAMAAGGWVWGHFVLAAMGASVDEAPAAAWRGRESCSSSPLAASSPNARRNIYPKTCASCAPSSAAKRAYSARWPTRSTAAHPAVNSIKMTY